MTHRPTAAKGGMGLTRKQAELLRFLEAEMEASGIAPSFAEMKDYLGLSAKSGVHRLLTALEQRGYIRRLHGCARAIEVLARSPMPGARSIPAPPVDNYEVIHLPMHGRINLNEYPTRRP